MAESETTRQEQATRILATLILRYWALYAKPSPELRSEAALLVRLLANPGEPKPWPGQGGAGELIAKATAYLITAMLRLTDQLDGSDSFAPVPPLPLFDLVRHLAAERGVTSQQVLAEAVARVVTEALILAPQPGNREERR